jgi:hypothetical protein
MNEQGLRAEAGETRRGPTSQGKGAPNDPSSATDTTGTARASRVRRRTLPK